MYLEQLKQFPSADVTGEWLVGFTGSCACGRNPSLSWVRFAYCFSALCLDISLNPVSTTYSQLQSLADVLCPELVLAVDFPSFGSKHESLGLELHPPVQPLETTGCPPAICTYNAKEYKSGRPSPGFLLPSSLSIASSALMSKSKSQRKEVLFCWAGSPSKSDGFNMQSLVLEG